MIKGHSRAGTRAEWAVRSVWFDQGAMGWGLVRFLLRPLSILFGVGVSVRNQGYESGFRPIQRAGIPILSVGNLSVGGTGKTPIARWIVERLIARGERPSVLSRGYGQDELALHRRWNPTVEVHADRDRVAAARAAEGAGATCGVMDDGFQHRALGRDADVVLVAAEDPFPPLLLPAGPFREPLSALRRASLVVVTSRGPDKEDQVSRWVKAIRALPQHPPVVHIPMVAAGWSDLDGEPVGSPPSDGPLMALLSVGRPEGFLPLVESVLPGAAQRTTLKVFRDHHPYTEADVLEIMAGVPGDTLLTTEKDAVKLLPFRDLLMRGGVRVFVLSMGIAMDERAEGILLRILDRVLEMGRAQGET